jgi:hypothetical protein
MLFSNTTYLGIDLNGRKPTYAALDHERRLLALARADVEAVLAFIGGQSATFVAVNAPLRPNRGLMQHPDVRARLTHPPRSGRHTDLRLADYLLLSDHGIRVPAVPAQAGDAPAWMQRGFAFHKSLAKLGCKPYPAEGASHQALETNAQATFSILLGHAPLPRYSLEGRLQRQLLLYEQGLGVADPMDFFEEITRRKLLLGVLPLDGVYAAEQLDALAAACTAWLAAERPNEIRLLGDEKEGRVVLPGVTDL